MTQVRPPDVLPSDGLLRCVLSTTGVPAVLTFDAEGSVVHTGPGVPEVLGWQSEQLHGSPVHHLVVGRDAREPEEPEPPGAPDGAVADACEALLRGDLSGRWLLRTADGGLLAADLTCSVFHDDGGRPAGGVLVATPVPPREDAHALLAAAEERCRAVFDSATTAMAVVGLGLGALGRIECANPAMGALTGRSPRELAGAALTDLLHPGERAAQRAALRAAAASGAGEPVAVLRRFTHRDGGQRLAQVSTALLSPAGAPVQLLVQALDVTGVHEDRDRLAASEEQFRLLFDRSLTAMAVVSLVAGERGRILRANAAMEVFTGRSREELSTAVVAQLLHPDERSAHLGYLRAAAEEGLTEPDGVLRRFVHRNGGVRLARKSTALVDPRGASEPHLLVQLDDVTEQHAAQEALARAALQDPLTGLANRARFSEVLERALAEEVLAPHGLVLLFADLDSFKPVNDEHGHAAGDAVLVAVAERLRRGVREGDTVARLGGDEFAVVCPGLAEEHVAVVLARLRAAVTAPVVLGSGVRVELGVSVGVATTVGGTSAQALLSAADAAMYAEKHRRRTGR